MSRGWPVSFYSREKYLLFLDPKPRHLETPYIPYSANYLIDEPLDPVMRSIHKAPRTGPSRNTARS